MENQIKERLAEAIETHVFPGAVVGVVRRDGSRTIMPVGNFTYEADSPAVVRDTVYDTASITKTIPVALLALKCIEQGELSLEDQVIKYLPEITIPDAENALIKHLLTYTYVLKKSPDPNYSHEFLQAADIFDFLYHREFQFLPGTHYEYSNTPGNLMGMIIEKVSGEKLYTLAKKLVFEPLEMKSTTFAPRDKENIPPTEVVSWRGVVQGEVHDEQASVLRKAGFNPGCAGLFSNVGDLLNVAGMMLNRGVYKGEKIFDEETIALMTTNALSGIGESSGIGWELNQPKFMGQYAGDQTIGKTGFTGTVIVADLERGIGFVLLSNRTYPERGSTAAINEVRRDISDMVLGSI